MLLNIPTWFTLLRVVMIPFFVLAFYLPFHWGKPVCAMIFIVAVITDWFDGFLARRWKQTTSFGAFLDPVADKLIVAMALVLIAEYFHAWWITLPTAVMIAREIIISALREWMARIGKHHSITVSCISKVKTSIQMLALVSLLWHPGEIAILIGIILLYIAAVLTFWSMFQYFYAVRHDLLSNE